MPPPSRENENSLAIESLRSYVLTRLDTLQSMMTNGLTHKEDFDREIGWIRKELDSIKTDIKTQAINTNEEVNEVIEKINRVEDNLLEKFEEVAKKQEEISSRNLKNIITVQAGAITIIVGFVLALLQAFIHH